MSAHPNWSSCGSTSTTRCSSRCSPRRSPTRPQTLPAELRADARLVFTAHSIPVAAAIPLRRRPLRPPGRLRIAAGRDRGRIRRLRPGVAVAVRTAAGAVAGARCRRPSFGACATRAPRPSSSARSVSSPTTSRWCGIWTTSCASRPTSAASRSPGRATPNADRRFARLAVDLIDELRDGREPIRSESPRGSSAPPLQGYSINGALCTPDCVVP